MEYKLNVKTAINIIKQVNVINNWIHENAINVIKL